MALILISGPKGGGKTLLAVRLAIERLRQTNDPVISTIELSYGALFEHYGIKAEGRVFRLNREQVKEFYLWRVEKGVLVRKEKRDANGNLQYDGVGSTFYLIDEGQAYWPARGYRDTKNETTIYLTMDRKLNDAVVVTTPHFGLVDKNFMRCGTEFVLCRNHKFERLGLFRGVPWMKARSYSSPPQRGDVVGYSTRYLVGKEGEVYRTEEGVGVLGTIADKGQKTKGVSMVWLPLVAAGVIWAISAAPDWALAAWGGKESMEKKVEQAGVKKELAVLGSEGQGQGRATNEVGVVKVREFSSYYYLHRKLMVLCDGVWQHVPDPVWSGDMILGGGRVYKRVVGEVTNTMAVASGRDPAVLSRGVYRPEAGWSGRLWP